MVILCNDCFNFSSCCGDGNRKNSFSFLMEEKFGPVQLKEDEKEQLKEEYHSTA